MLIVVVSDVLLSVAVCCFFALCVAVCGCTLLFHVARCCSVSSSCSVLSFHGLLMFVVCSCSLVEVVGCRLLLVVVFVLFDVLVFVVYCHVVDVL